MKKKLTALLSFVIFLLVILTSYLMNTNDVLSTKVSAVSADLNVPARYAFVSDHQEKKLAVIDSYQKKVIDYLDLKVVPDFIEMSKSQGVLAYGHYGEKTIYLLDLETHQEQTLSFAKPVHEFVFHSETSHLVVALEDSVEVYSFFPKLQLVNAIENLNITTALTITPDGRYLVIVSKDGEGLYFYHFETKAVSSLPMTDTMLTDLAVSPDGSIIALLGSQGKDKSHLYWISLSEQKIVQTLPIDGGMPIRPYITNDGQRLIALTEKSGYQFSLVSKLEIGRAHFETEIKEIKTGWLEQKLLLMGDKKLFIYDLVENKLSSEQSFDRLGDVLVMADSKTVLIVDEVESNLVFFDLQSEQITDEIPLLKLSDPSILVMAETNTVCH